MMESQGKRRVSDGVYCPYCGAFSFPYVIEPDPTHGVYCKACNRDMKPMIAAMKQYIEDATKLAKGEDIERIPE